MKLFKKKPQDPISLFIFNHFGVYPNDLDLYERAFTHKSSAPNGEPNNERLEFLGDAILDVVVSEYLFTELPQANEGELTKLRARIVSRETLNKIGIKLELLQHVRYFKGNNEYKSLEGDVFEALLGALYLDQGFEATNQILVESIIIPFINLKEIQTTDTDYKSRVLIWSQRKQKKVSYRLSEVNSSNVAYLAKLYVDGELCSEATGRTKKEAEKYAAKLFLRKIKAN